jgi:hypothetical protein
MGDEHAAFRREVEASQLQDPMPAFEGLSQLTGVPVEKLVHHALVRWTREGAETLMAVEPPVLGRLWDAREREDWIEVAGILDWLRAGASD